MAKYKLSTGLATVREQPDFDTDREADKRVYWNI